MIRRRLEALGALAALSTLAAAGPARSADVVIPSAAFSKGKNDAEFHSDVRILNPGDTLATFVPVFYDQASGGAVTGPTLSVGPHQQLAFDNVIDTLFGSPLGSFGPIRLTSDLPLLVSTSVSNVHGCGGTGGALGQWLPGVDPSAAPTSGTLGQLAVSADPSTGHRTNLSVVNPGTKPAHVTVKVHAGDGSVLSTATLPELAPNGFFQKPLDDPLFPSVAGRTDSNLWAELASDLPIIAFATVIDNASGDPFAILMTADVPAPPVVSYSVSPGGATVGQTVTFTDTTPGPATSQLWSFGDGATAASGASVRHAYAAPGTYATSHFVVNAAGAASASHDVTVTGVPATDVEVVAKQYTFDPSVVTLNAGTTYRITWRSADVTHGILIEELGIDCQAIPGTPCVAVVTPKSSQAGTIVYHCSFFCGPGHEVMGGQIKIVP